MKRHLLPCGLLILAGCASDQEIKRLPPPTPLRLTMQSFTETYAVSVEKTADDIADLGLSTEINRNTVFWKMRAIPMIRKPLLLGDDQVALLGMWMSCARISHFFEDGAGKDYFGKATPLAIDVSKKLEAEIEALASANLTERQQIESRKQIDDYISGHPIAGSYSVTEEDRSSWDSGISAILGKSLHVIETPFRYLDPTGGLNDTASAVHRVAATLELVIRTMSYLPDQLRWDAELMLYEIEENPAVISALGSLAEVSEASRSLANTVPTLPAELQEGVSQVLTEVEQKQPELQQTLKEARATVEGVDRTAKSLTQMGEVWTGTIDAASKVAGEFSKPDQAPSPPEEKGAPFDINDYGRTADRLTDTANAITLLLERIEGLTDPQEAGRALDTADDAVDRLLLRGGLFVLFVFAVALAYRQIDRRLARSSRA